MPEPAEVPVKVLASLALMLACTIGMVAMLALCVRVAGTADAKWVAFGTLGALALWPLVTVGGRRRR